MTNGRLEVISRLNGGGAGARGRGSSWWWPRWSRARACQRSREKRAFIRANYGWRRQLRGRQGIGFAPVRIAPEIVPAVSVGHCAIEIELASGVRMRICGRSGDGACSSITTREQCVSIPARPLSRKRSSRATALRVPLYPGASRLARLTYTVRSLATVSASRSVMRCSAKTSW